jgi:hypothetical protein
MENTAMTAGNCVERGVHKSVTKNQARVCVNLDINLVIAALVSNTDNYNLVTSLIYHQLFTYIHMYGHKLMVADVRVGSLTAYLNPQLVVAILERVG